MVYQINTNHDTTIEMVCPSSRCYDNGGRIVGRDTLTSVAQATRQAIVQCLACTSDGGNAGGGANAFIVNGRIVAANVQAGVNFWAPTSSSTDVVLASPTLPYTLAGDATVAIACWLAPFAGTVSNWWVRNDLNLADEDTRTFTLYIGRPSVSSSTATLSSVVFTSATATAVLSDDTSTFAFLSGDLLSIGVATSVAGGETFQATCSFVVTPS